MKSLSRIRRKNRSMTIRVGLTTGGLLTAILTSATPAYSYTWGCGSFNGTDPTIIYRYYSMESRYQTAFGRAQSAWDATSVPGYLKYSPDNADPMIEVRDGSYTWGDWARTTGTCAGGLWLYNEVKITFNTRTMNSLYNDDLKLVATHEIGHAYGIDHVSPTCSDPHKAVMSQGQTKFSCSGTAPWADDINGVHNRYWNLSPVRRSSP